MRLTCFSIFTFLISLSFYSPLVLCQTMLSYAVAKDQTDERSQFPIKLLHAIVAEQDTQLNITSIPIDATQHRVLHLLDKGHIDMAWFAADKDRLAKYHAVQIPIAKGLLGYRMLLVHDHNNLAFTPITDLQQLKNYTFVQGLGWPDNRILKHHELGLLTVSDYHRMFKLVDAGRIDIFPRSIIEIWQELDSHQALNLTVNDSVALHYPSALYYFFRKENKQQAEIIRRGFEKLIDSGEYDLLFNAYFGQILQRSNLATKRIIEMDNPYFEIPESQRHYFYSLNDIGKNPRHAMASNSATTKDAKLAEL